ncbi:uncharacterized protein LOC124795373 isoform X1 [Schistocerca piceifrons]|uniref:uncharacterized protein LOC124795373 isoform X1 n=1 Tax=Schistocerca piceifrons TaxID=274613 RepID=UPI001F5F829A|nr:uncharacterized protein LOC124795373 isoform X1 [Schistocerca piceifrons]
MNDPANVRCNTIMTCRLCLNRDSFALDIFSKLAESKEIHDKIRICIPGLKIFEDDALPKHVCFRCLYKLEQSSDFIKQCIMAESVLTKNSHPHEGEPLTKTRKTNVFSSLNCSEPDANGITQAESDNSFDDLDIRCISNGFKESHLNGNRITAQAHTHKTQDRSTSFGFNGTTEQCDRRIPDRSKSNQRNWKDEGTHYKRAPSATTYGESCSTSQLPREFLHSSYFKNDTSKNIQTHKHKEYLNLGENKQNFLKDAAQKSSPLRKQKIASPMSFIHQLPSGSIKQVDIQTDNDSDEEINQHIKILNSLRNKCPL